MYSNPCEPEAQEGEHCEEFQAVTVRGDISNNMGHLQHTALLLVESKLTDTAPEELSVSLG